MACSLHFWRLWRAAAQVGWNKFDLLLVTLALVDILVNAVQLSFLRVLRVLRMTRVVHLAKAAGMVRLVKIATVCVCVSGLLDVVMPDAVRVQSVAMPALPA
jgi:hypothetical protein